MSLILLFSQLLLRFQHSPLVLLEKMLELIFVDAFFLGLLFD